MNHHSQPHRRRRWSEDDLKVLIADTVQDYAHSEASKRVEAINERSNERIEQLQKALSVLSPTSKVRAQIEDELAMMLLGPTMKDLKGEGGAKLVERLNSQYL